MILLRAEMELAETNRGPGAGLGDAYSAPC